MHAVLTLMFFINLFIIFSFLFCYNLKIYGLGCFYGLAAPEFFLCHRFLENELNVANSRDGRFVGDLLWQCCCEL